MRNTPFLSVEGKREGTFLGARAPCLSRAPWFPTWALPWRTYALQRMRLQLSEMWTALQEP